MNYIKQLQAELKQTKAALQAATTGLSELRYYVNSDKFCGEGNNYVNTGDIDLRVTEVLTAVSDVQCLAPERFAEPKTVQDKDGFVDFSEDIKPPIHS